MKHAFHAVKPNDYTLHKNQVDVWQFSLLNLTHDASLTLNETELARAHRYHFERHRRRFMIARATMRLILSHYLNVTPQELVFGENEYGKPYLVQYPEVQFNLSHSKNLSLLAVGLHHPLGVDLEFFSDRPLTGIAKLMFSAKELKAFQAVPNALQTLAFFHIWAQKEAFIKACGLGLSYPTQDFDVPILPSTNQAIWDAKHEQLWHMVSFQPSLRCCAALCYHPSIQTIRYQDITHSIAPNSAPIQQLPQST